MKTSTSLRSPAGALTALWWGWIAAPVWWLAQFELRYALIPGACHDGQPHRVLVVGFAAFGVALVLAGWAWTTARRSEPNERVFLRHGSVALSCLFALLILAQILPELFLGVCRQ